MKQFHYFEELHVQSKFQKFDKNCPNTIICKNLNDLPLELLPAKFQNNWMSGSGEIVENVF